MAIPDEDVAKVRAATDLAALIGEHTALKRVGRRLVGLCPFHGEKSPSFSVNAEEGLYYCFGCQASGDAISFVRAVEGCDFVEAVERLAARAGVTVRNDAPGDAGPGRGRRAELYEALEVAARFYHECLLNHPDARGARQYLRSRGYDGDVVRRFQLGFAPASYDALVRSRLLPATALREAGLAYDSSRGRLIDAFRERIMFPISDPGNRVVALGGRILPAELRTLPGEPGGKYRNSPESAIYQKRATLYGLNWAKGEITRTKQAIVCEGYTDVIGFATAGLPQAVATCGTALTEEHIRLLGRFAESVVLCFDADAAGEHAAERLYEWERRHELELRVAELPAGSDPADLARTDPDALRSAIAHAAPFLAFRVEGALRHVDLTTPEGRAKGAELALDAVGEHPNPLVRDQYLLAIADRTRLEPDRLREVLERSVAALANRGQPAPPRRRGSAEEEPPPREPEWLPDEPSPPPRAARRPARTTPDVRAGRNALALCIQQPDVAAGWVRRELFSDPVQLDAFDALSRATDLHEAIESASEETADLILRLAVQPDVEEIDASGTLIELVRSATTRAIRARELELRRLDADGRPDAVAHSVTELAWARGELELLRDPDLVPGRPSAALAAAERLLAWLGSESEDGG